MADLLLAGADVSKFQTPSLVNWSALDFGIVRASYGKWADPQAAYHMAQIRAGKAVPGLYAFFRADQDPIEQATTFFQACQLMHLGAGDLIPWVDTEDFPGHTISPRDMAALETFVDRADSLWGCAVGMYVSQRDWVRFGKPGWILERPLWVPHYPKEGSTQRLARPATPNSMPWRIWQYMVGPLGQSLQAPRHKRAIDQDMAISPLPLLTAVEPKPMPRDPLSSIPWLGLQDSDWQEMVASRDHTVIEEEEQIT